MRVWTASPASTARRRRWRSAATLLRESKFIVHNWYDTAGSAKHVAELGDKSAAAIASTLAGEFYGLKVLKADVEDEHHNATRFLIMSRQDDAPPTAARW